MTAALVATLVANVFYLTMTFYYFYVFATLAATLPVIAARPRSATERRVARARCGDRTRYVARPLDTVRRRSGRRADESGTWLGPRGNRWARRTAAFPQASRVAADDVGRNPDQSERRSPPREIGSGPTTSLGRKLMPVDLSPRRPRRRRRDPGSLRPEHRRGPPARHWSAGRRDRSGGHRPWDGRPPVLAYLARAADQYWVAERDGRVIGFARAVRDDGIAS